MNNKLFAGILFLIIAPVFGWMVYDSKTSAEALQKENVRRDLLSDAQGGSAALIQYLFRFPDPVYSHNLDTGQIEVLSHSGGGGEGYHVSGLTQAAYKIEALYQFNSSKKWFKKEYVLWVDDLKVDFSYTNVNVYVSSGYPEDSCEYQATLDHENRHVEVHKRIYEQYQRVLQQAVADAKDIPLASHPILAGSKEEGKERIAGILSAVTDPVFERYKEALTAEQAQLDSPQSYAELKTNCQGW